MNRRDFLGASALAAAGVVLGPGHQADAASLRFVVDDTVRAHGPVALLGDSLSSGFVTGLRKEMVAHDVGPFRLDVRPGRAINTVRGRADAGADRVAVLRAGGFDPPNWVIGLGGNDFTDFGRGRLDPTVEIEKLLDLIGPDRAVAWLTIWHKRTPLINEQFNAALHEIATRRPNLRVVEWAEILRVNKRWFIDDVHFGMRGAIRRNLMMAEAAAALDGAGKRTAPPPGR